VRRRRVAAGLTQEELAWRSGLSVRAVADIERGRTARPYRRSVALLADALELSGEDRALLAKAARTAKAEVSSPVSRPASVSLPAMALPPPVPHQLPASVRYFTGRVAELRDLAGLLEPAGAAGGTVVISAITGTAGEELAGRRQAQEWFQAERQVLLAAISQAADGRFGVYAWQLSWAAAGFFGGQGYWPELVATSSPRWPPRGGPATMPGRPRRTATWARPWALAVPTPRPARTCPRPWSWARQAGSLALQARVHMDLGRLTELQGRSLDALGHAEQSLRLYRAAGNRFGEADALNQVGWEHARLGGYQRALEFCEQALALHREMADRPGEAVTLDSLGYAHHHLGHHREAIACYRQAIDVHGEAGAAQVRTRLSHSVRPPSP
jgi:tetratricopeptide (TPR) repeat protein